jgi:hypothetical protein
MLIETRKALGSIAEAIEISKMLEELMAPGRESQLLSVLPGLRLTLKDTRERMTKAHSAIALDVVNTAKERIAEMKQNRVNLQASKGTEAASAHNAAAAPNSALFVKSPMSASQSTDNISGLSSRIETLIEP